MTISHVTGLILIDCWEDDHCRGIEISLPKHKFFTDLVHNLKRFNFIGVINASMYLTPSPNIPLGKEQKTSVIVQEFLSEYTPIAHVTTQSEFLKLRKSDHWKNINHWLVVGTTWQICCHLNDLGLCSFTTMLRQHPELNFYGVSWGFLKHNLTTTTDEDFEHDLLTWTKSGEMFKLAAEQIIDLGRATQHTRTMEFRDKYIDEIPH